MEKVKINVVATKKNAKKILTLMEDSNLVEFPLAEISEDQISDFLDRKRNNIATFEINGEDLMEVQANSASASLLLKLLDETSEKGITFPPIPRVNIEDFISNKRDSLLTMNLVYTGDEEEEEVDEIIETTD